MAGEAERRYGEVVAQGAPTPTTAPRFEAKDLESVTGKYDVVTCLDVMIHYPQVGSARVGAQGLGVKGWR